MPLIDYEDSPNLGSRVEMYLFETEDGRYKWAYTTDHESRTVAGTTFVPEAISRSGLKQTAGDANVEKLMVTVPFDNPVAVIHVPYLPPRPVKVTVYAYQRNDPASEIVQAFVGFITSFNQKGAVAELECSQIIDTLNQSVPWAVFKSDCNWALYAVGCGVDKALYTEVINDLVTVDGDLLTSPTFSLFPDGWFTNGFAVDPSTGEQRFITAHDATAGTIRVVYPFLHMEAGMELHALAGCDRKKGTCVTKFNNKINYLAFDHFPNYNVFQQGIT